MSIVSKDLLRHLTYARFIVRPLYWGEEEGGGGEVEGLEVIGFKHVSGCLYVE